VVKPRVKQTKLSGLRPHEKNPRDITPERMADLKVALVEDVLMLQARPLIALPDGRVICGNQRLAAAEELGWVTIPTVTVDLDEKTALQWMLRDNQGYGDWVDDQLASILVNMGSSDLVLTGFGADDLAELLAPASKYEGIVLSDRFGAPPWSVLSGDVINHWTWRSRAGSPRSRCDSSQSSISSRRNRRPTPGIRNDGSRPDEASS